MAVAAQVGDLTRARERRARSLIERRSELAARWAEALSHQEPDAEDLAYEIALVEEAISRGYPSIFDQHFADWINHDAALLHTPGDLNVNCRRCIATAGGHWVA
jgi:hypothetical protein